MDWSTFLRPNQGIDMSQRELDRSEIESIKNRLKDQEMELWRREHREANHAVIYGNTVFFAGESRYCRNPCLCILKYGERNNVGVPEREAIRLRDVLLGLYPVKKYPVKKDK